MARRRDPDTVRVSLLGDVFTPIAALAIGRLGWSVGRIAADDAKALRSEAGGKIVSVAKLLDQPDCAIVVVGSPAPDRVAHAERLLAAGVHVLLAPFRLDPDDATRLTAASEPSGARVMIADPFPTSPAIQEWLRSLPNMSDIDHVSGTVSVDGSSGARQLDPRLWSMVDVVRFTAIQAGWGQIVGSTSNGTVTTYVTTGGPTIDVEILHGDGPPRWELQAAGPHDVLRLSMLPSPEFERSGDPVDLVQPHPSVAFGVEAMLKNFVTLTGTGGPVPLDPHFAAATTALLP